MPLALPVECKYRTSRGGTGRASGTQPKHWQSQWHPTQRSVVDETLEISLTEPNRQSMFQVSREIEFCYGHRLLDYPGKCRHLHGHNGKVLISAATSKLDKLGMVIDFGDIKEIVARWIDENLDHCMILHRDDPAVPMFQKLGEPVFLMDVNPTAENIAKLIFDTAASRGFPVTEVRLWETPRCYATYSPDADGK